MPVITLNATVDGPNADWSYAGSTDIAVVMGTDDATDETNRINVASDNSSRHEWYVDALPAGAASVSQVDSTFYVRSSSSEEIEAYIHDGTTELTIRDADPGGSGGNYTDWTDTDLDHPTDGADAWEPGDFPGGTAGIYMGVKSSTNNAGTVFCTFAKLDVTYVPQAGGWMWLLGCWAAWIAPIAGAALRPQELAACFERRTKGLIRPSSAYELQQLVEHMKRRPIYGR